MMPDKYLPTHVDTFQHMWILFCSWCGKSEQNGGSSTIQGVRSVYRFRCEGCTLCMKSSIECGGHAFASQSNFALYAMLDNAKAWAQDLAWGILTQRL